MDIYFITFRSVTPGQQGERILHRNGFRCSLQRTPKWMEEQGCGYCLRLRTERIDPVIRLLRSNQVAFRKVYLQHGDGNVEEVAV